MDGSTMEPRPIQLWKEMDLLSKRNVSNKAQVPPPLPSPISPCQIFQLRDMTRVKMWFKIADAVTFLHFSLIKHIRVYYEDDDGSRELPRILIAIYLREHFRPNDHFFNYELAIELSLKEDFPNHKIKAFNVPDTFASTEEKQTFENWIEWRNREPCKVFDISDKDLRVWHGIVLQDQQKLVEENGTPLEKIQYERFLNLVEDLEGKLLVPADPAREARKPHLTTLLTKARREARTKAYEAYERERREQYEDRIEAEILDEESRLRDVLKRFGLHSTGPGFLERRRRMDERAIAFQRKRERLHREKEASRPKPLFGREYITNMFAFDTRFARNPNSMCKWYAMCQLMNTLDWKLTDTDREYVDRETYPWRTTYISVNVTSDHRRRNIAHRNGDIGNDSASESAFLERRRVPQLDTKRIVCLR